MTMRKLYLAVALASGISVPAVSQAAENAFQPSNFSYSTLGFQLGRATPDEDIVFLNERYEDFGAASLFGSFQAADNIAFGINLSAIANEGDRTELSQTAASVQMLVPLGIGNQVDIVPRFGFGRFEAEACVDGFCATEDDSAAVYGVSFRAWVVPSLLELTAGFNDTTLDDSESALSLGAALWARDHHRFGLDYEGSDSITVVTLGYSYNW